MLLRELRTPLAIVALLASGTLGNSANALDYLTQVVHGVVDTNGQIVRGVVMPNGDIIDASGRVIGHSVVGLLDPMGNIINPTTSQTITRIYAPAEGTTTVTKTTSSTTPSRVIFSNTLVTVIDNRRLEIARMIDAAVAAGALKEGDAGEFRRSLQRIEAAEIADRASGDVFSYDEASDVARDLDSLASSIAAASRLQPLPPLIVVDSSGAIKFNIAPSGYFISSTQPAVQTTKTTVTETQVNPGASSNSVTRTETTTTKPVYQDKVIEQTTTTTTTPGTLITTPAGSSAIVTTAAPGSVVYVRDIAPATYVTTLEVRRSDLRKLIVEAKDKNVINKRKADRLLAELDRIHREAVPTITYGRAVVLASDLDTIGTQIVDVVPAVPQPIISGSHLTISDGHLATMDDVAARRADLEARIAKDYLQERLTQKQADDLRERMNAIDTMEATFRQHGGDLSLKESRILYSNYDKVASDLDKWAGKENQ